MHDIDGTAAVSWGADRIDLFWVDTDGALVHRADRAGPDTFSAGDSDAVASRSFARGADREG